MSNLAALARNPKPKAHVPARQILAEHRDQQPAARDDDQQEDPLADIGAARRAPNHIDRPSLARSAPGQRILQAAMV